MVVAAESVDDDRATCRMAASSYLGLDIQATTSGAAESVESNSIAVFQLLRDEWMQGRSELWDVVLSREAAGAFYWTNTYMRVHLSQFRRPIIVD
jgi:hypothetical protein